MIDFLDRAWLTDREAVADQLTGKGLGLSSAQEKAELFVRAATALMASAQGGPHAQAQAYYVPGRIEVLGKHTDYAGGSTLVAAAERGFCLAACARDDQQITVIDALGGEEVRFEFSPHLVPRLGHWSNYPMTVARRLARNFPGARRGADIALVSDLPPAAGMSSSSAFIIAMFRALAGANELWNQPGFPEELHLKLMLAGYLATVENGQSFGRLPGDSGVGTRGGSEDHVAILCAQPNHLFQYAYRPTQAGPLTLPACFERKIPLPAGFTFAIGVSGVIADKTGAALEKYNRAARLVSALLQLWRRGTGQEVAQLAIALQNDPRNLDRLRAMIHESENEEFSADALTGRLEHFCVENEQIMPLAGPALFRGDLAEFGRLVDASQQNAEKLLGNQVPETMYLAREARRHGAAAASAFGAGFGGSVWALVEQSKGAAFLSTWSIAYHREFPQHAGASSFFLTGAGPAAFRLEN